MPACAPAAALCSGVTWMRSCRATSVGLRAALEQELRRVLLAEERRVVERREAVGRPGAGELRLGVEQLLEPARAADGGRVEHVERRVRGEQDVDEARLPVVERLQHGREPGLGPRRRELGPRLDQPPHRLLVAGGDRGMELLAHAGTLEPE